MIKIHKENNTIEIIYKDQKWSEIIPYEDCNEKTLSRGLISNFKELIKNHIVFATTIDGEKKYFSIKTELLKITQITNKALEIIQKTKGAENRFKAWRNEISPAPSLSPDIRSYCAKGQDLESQRIYSTTTDTIIAELVQILNSSENSKYQTIMNTAAIARQDLAKAQNSPNSIDFGHKKDPKEYSYLVAAITRLAGPYQEYGQYLKKVVEEAIKDKTSSELQEGIVINDKKHANLNSSVTIRRRFAENILDYNIYPNNRLQYAIEDYQAFDAFIVSVTLNSSIEASHYVLRMPIEDASVRSKMKNAGFKLLKKDTYPIIIHTQPQKFKRLEFIIEEQFNRCLVKENDPTKLKENMAILRYLFSQATFYNRGSAAIAEWVEKAIYKYHGYEFEYKYPENEGVEGKPSGDLDAFTSLTLTDYINTYVKKANLTPFSYN
jgi:hypothetical protein